MIATGRAADASAPGSGVRRVACISLALQALLAAMRALLKLFPRGFFSHHPDEALNHSVDAVLSIMLYSVALARNEAFLRHLLSVPTMLPHPAREDAWWPSVTRDGMWSLLAELTTMSTIGIAIHAVALQQAGTPGAVVLSLIAVQCLNFVWLLRLVVAVELSWRGLTHICRVEQVAMALMLALDLALQLGAGLSSGDFATRQFVALAALTSLRLRLLSFFEFKAVRPSMSYCRPLHCELEALGVQPG